MTHRLISIISNALLHWLNTSFFRWIICPGYNALFSRIISSSLLSDSGYWAHIFMPHDLFISEYPSMDILRFFLNLQCCCCCCAHNLQLILSIRQRLTRGVGGYSRKFKSLNILWPRCCSHFWLFLSSSNWPVSGWRNFRWSFITRFFFSKNVNAIVLY